MNVNFYSAFLAFERLSRKSTEQVIKGAFPECNGDKDMFNHMYNKYESARTTLDFYTSLDMNNQRLFDTYLNSLL